MSDNFSLNLLSDLKLKNIVEYLSVGQGIV